MSFSSNVKAELCRQTIQKKCCALSECYGVLLYCNTFSAGLIRIVTESTDFAERLPRLFKRAFGFGFDDLPDGQTGKQIFQMTDRAKIAAIFAQFGYAAENSLALHLNLGVLEDECCRASLLRGAFLAGGSVTNPEKRYHLELTTSHQSVGRETYSLMLEMGFRPKDTMRGGNFVLYFKQSEAIEDFLTLLGAPLCAMEIMEAKVEKDLRNSVNRRVNCETANLTKVVDAAQEQLAAIRRLNLDELPPKLRQTAQLRIENPECTLSELAEMVDPPITKSAINHRMRKLIELSGRVGGAL